MTRSPKVRIDHQELQHHISFRNNDETKSLLKKHLEYLDKTSDEFGKLLHYAAQIDNPDITVFLISQGIDVDWLDEYGKSPLATALEFRRFATVKVLLDAGANVDFVDAKGQTPLRMAASLNLTLHSKIIQAFVHRIKFETLTTKQLGERLCAAGYTLHQAAMLNEVEVLKGLLQCGSDVDSRIYDDKTALHLAAQVSDLKIVEILIANGANVNVLDKDGGTPLFYAANRGEFPIIKVLLEEGADPNAKNKLYDTTPWLKFCAEAKTTNLKQLEICIMIFLQHGAVLGNDCFSPVSPSIPGNLLFFERTEVQVFLAHRALLSMIGRLTDESIFKEERVSARVMKELEELKEYYDNCKLTLETTVFGKASLVDLLTDNEYKMRCRARNEKFVSVVESGCSASELNKCCLYYYDWLLKRTVKAARMVQMENEAIPLICEIFQRNHNECYLPAMEIFGYLSERDLKNLCQVWMYVEVVNNNP